MKLYSNWKEIVKKAWSIRFVILAGILSAIEAILPFFYDVFSRGTFAILSFIAIVLAFVSRLVVQKGIDE
jgi:hypothetical protein